MHIDIFSSRPVIKAEQYGANQYKYQKPLEVEKEMVREVARGDNTT